jgi:hypothetical protein
MFPVMEAMYGGLPTTMVPWEPMFLTSSIPLDAPTEKQRMLLHLCGAFLFYRDSFDI